MFAIKSRVLVLGCALMLSMGCAVVGSPPRWLPGIEEAQRQAFGGWVTVYFPRETGKGPLEGELIAVQEDSLLVLSGSQVMAVHQADVRRARLAVYRNQATAAGIATVLGILSTAAHGLYLVLSAPIWFLAGTGMTVTESYGGFLDYPQHPWEELGKFARFPQGLPKGLDINALKTKK